MQINGSSSFSYQPTRLPVQSSLSPEEKNKLQDTVQEGLSARQATQEAQDTAKRTAVVGYTAAENKQDSVDLYVSVSTGNDLDNDDSGVEVSDLREVQQRQQLAQTIQTLDTLEQSKTNPLQQRIDGMVGVFNQQGSLFSAQA